MDHAALVVVVVITLGLIAGWLWRRRQIVRQQASCQLAQRQFAKQRPALASIMLQAAAQTGKPRGLSWEKCDLGDNPVFARDRVTGSLYALIGATISFSAIPGGGMEDVEAVGNLRYATAVFVYRDKQWQSDGQVVFNLEPEQALAHYSQSLSPVPKALPPGAHKASD